MQTAFPKKISKDIAQIANNSLRKDADCFWPKVHTLSGTYAKRQLSISVGSAMYGSGVQVNRVSWQFFYFLFFIYIIFYFDPPKIKI